MAIPLSPPHTHAVALGDGWVLHRPAMARLAVLNATGKLVWNLASEGHGRAEIAAVFARQFGLSDAQAQADVGAVLTDLEDAGFLSYAAAETGPARGDPLLVLAPIEASPQAHKVTDCGTFRFGTVLVTIHSTVPGIDATYFSRFGHRYARPDAGADEDGDVLELIGTGSGYRLAFRGETAAEDTALADLLGRVHELLLSWEYPDTALVAYFHAAAIRRGGRTILLPGVSGVGKSTLTAWLVAQGFGYLGDDLIAMRAADGALLPSPTLLSLKSGAWPILEPLYPALSQQSAVPSHGRIMRFIAPDGADSSLDHDRGRRRSGRRAPHTGVTPLERCHEKRGQVPDTDGRAAPAPTAIVFPRYGQDQPTRLEPLPPLLAMARLIESNLALHQPVSEAALAQFIRFVEQTPAYALTYSDLHEATTAIDALLAPPP